MATMTEQTRTAVWGTLCDLEWNKRYYAAMADKYKRTHLSVRFPILSGIVAEGFILYFVREHIGLLLALGTIWDALSDYAQNAANLQNAEFTCDSLLQEVEELWRAIESGRMELDDAESALQSIKRRWAASTERARVRTDQRINNKAYDDANEDYEIGMRFSDSSPRQAPGPERPPRPQPPPPRPTPSPRENEPNRHPVNPPRPARQ